VRLSRWSHLVAAWSAGAYRGTAPVILDRIGGMKITAPTASAPDVGTLRRAAAECVTRKQAGDYAAGGVFDAKHSGPCHYLNQSIVGYLNRSRSLGRREDLKRKGLHTVSGCCRELQRAAPQGYMIGRRLTARRWRDQKRCGAGFKLLPIACSCENARSVVGSRNV